MPFGTGTEPRIRRTTATCRCARIVTDTPPRRDRVVPSGLDGAIIYELHVGGFTRHSSSGVQHPGTFAGLIEKIPYLRELGVTHVELLPVMAFDETGRAAARCCAGAAQLLGLHQP